VYVTVTIPALRTIVDPLAEDSRNDRVEAMRILAAGNTIIMFVLGAILALQASVYNSLFDLDVLIHFIAAAGWSRVCQES
jgi:hypothetical protein